MSQKLWSTVNDLPNDVPHWTSVEEAVKDIDSWDNTLISIRHVLKLKDGSFVWMGHINCEHCCYCAEKNENPSLSIKAKHLISGPHRFRCDPYGHEKDIECSTS